MTVRHLDKLFRPTSVAVVGASERKGSVGNLVMHNLLEGGFDGPIMPVNHHRSVAGVLTYKGVSSLPETPDLAVICTPPDAVPRIVQDLCDRGTRAAVVLTAGLGSTPAADGAVTAQDQVLAIAHKYGMRILGPNCLGLLVPGIGLNASFAHLPALPGNIAFASQSGAMCTAVLDWARARGIGFSHFISMGDALDTDFGDVLDYLGSDPGTRAILLYVESIRERRGFMSAGRAAARNKPVLVIKAGRSATGAAAARSHTGALAGADAVYDAAFRRAGMLRVDSIEEIFAAVETLARAPKFPGDRLAIVTNGGGIGVMAVDRLAQLGGRLAELSEHTLAALDKVLPPTWSRGNPADIIGDAPPERYAAAMRTLIDTKESDAVLVMHAPTATASSTAAAQAVIDIARETKAPVLANWVGQEAVAPARKMLRDAGIPTYDTPGEAVGAFMHLITYKRNQEMLTETPVSLPAQFNPATAVARLVIEGHLASGDTMMSEPEAKSVLAAYGVPTVETHIVKTPPDAAAKAQAMGFPVALKILSPDISHKSDVGGVDLFLDTPEAVTASGERMLRAIGEKFPDARIQGFTVQKMAGRTGAHELIVGVTCDPIFGPVILFGQGGTAVEVIADRAVSLPPLNMHLARDLITRTRVWRLLQGYRDTPPVDMDALCLTLVQISQMVVDIPELMELDINPLLADANGVLALDARIRVASPADDRSRDLAIRPYPAELEEWFTLTNGAKVLLRPIRPEDEPEHRHFLDQLTPEDIRFRFFGLVREFPHSEIARLTQIDYDREMAFIASAPKEGGGRETLGVVRTVTDPDNETCEFAVIVRSDLKGLGLGHKLLAKMIAYCRARGTRTMTGQVMAENHPMLDMVRNLGFRVRRLPDEPVMETTLELS
ncbi:MAG: GNAT family N-acetyltransferase [Rhodospirillales bacterium CG15_BIG_FIL_POST_REV_8_21_14_020_66_15]|nr:MAG: GNAT family N-acetyltransferase [Rhodospirillales bacterium CG15_BIG_FIL_POST_REV_8_21_14_020_66_15]